MILPLLPMLASLEVFSVPVSVRSMAISFRLRAAWIFDCEQESEWERQRERERGRNEGRETHRYTERHGERARQLYSV